MSMRLGDWVWETQTIKVILCYYSPEVSIWLFVHTTSASNSVFLTFQENRDEYQL